MKRCRVALGGARLGAALTCLSALACSGETRVSLLDPIIEHRPDAGKPDATLPDALPDVSSPVDPHLIHRYSFDGKGLTVIDSIGAANGTLENGAELKDVGNVALDGEDDFVALPSGLISSLSAATVVSWLAWSGGGCWQRVFDFGSNDHDAGAVGYATSSVFATVLRCPDDGPTAGPGAVFQLTKDPDASVPVNVILGAANGTSRFPRLSLTSLSVVFDPPHQEFRLYVAGKLAGKDRFGALSSISDENDWLGRSQWVQDIALNATLDEFRIYDVALDDESIAAIDVAGPDSP